MNATTAQAHATCHLSVFAVANAEEVLRQLLVAGLDTTATVLKWSFLYMIVYPEVQEKVQHEIDTLVGKPSLHQHIS